MPSTLCTWRQSSARMSIPTSTQAQTITTARMSTNTASRWRRKVSTTRMSTTNATTRSQTKWKRSITKGQTITYATTAAAKSSTRDQWFSQCSWKNTYWWRIDKTISLPMREVSDTDDQFLVYCVLKFVFYIIYITYLLLFVNSISFFFSTLNLRNAVYFVSLLIKALCPENPLSLYSSYSYNKNE